MEEYLECKEWECELRKDLVDRGEQFEKARREIMARDNFRDYLRRIADEGIAAGRYILEYQKQLNEDN
jgi:hypothetical protein